ncbi:PREDICTED: protein NRT1/ PTR FAMILY 5.2-like [Tarenaya hassleriana]|uniref:protein NRT1/ PTR FAMILY 5.2-like n=1 Tax=Tarenaya hassleriana TaxID=28532 RepID=UPI00053C314F|nr:PREDICTED: protein NRT1/ PTR FAMILY 5.2-like [Tarenaya hassleriana]
MCVCVCVCVYIIAEKKPHDSAPKKSRPRKKKGRKKAMTVEEAAVDDYTRDGTVDLNGNRVRRSQRGGWKACSFVVVYEIFERMAYYGISSNLVIFMTTKLHQGTVKSANNVTNWVGTSWLTPILGAYVADAHLGRYLTFVISCAIYFSGMLLLTLSVSLPSLKPPACTVEDCPKASTLQLAVFFGALYTLAVGTGGTKPNISTIGADQFDDFHPVEKSHKLSFFNWWMFSIFFGTLFANTVLVYIQDNVGWALGYGLPTMGLAISITIFLLGTPFYRHKVPTGSPFTKMARVFVASLRKSALSLPSDTTLLHELPLEHYASKNAFIIRPTPSLRFLDKASVKTEQTHQWSLCTVTEVEETKQMLRMLPILFVTFVPSVMLAQVNTLFVKQGTTLDRSLTPRFSIPPASLGAFVTFSMLVSIVLYDRFFVKIMRKLTGNPRGITLLQRMGIGLVLHIVIMTVACLTERHRLKVAAEHGLVNQAKSTLPLTIFVLLPQFVLMGMADAFLEVAKLEFFYDQAPESMKSLGTSYSTTTLAVGNFLSSFLLSTVSKITERRGRGWILNNLNASRLDYYYTFFVVLNLVNFVLFLAVVRFYRYRAEASDSMDANQEQLKVMGAKENEQEPGNKA